MRILLQRVSRASVTVDGEMVGRIGPGILVLAGFKRSDRAENLGRLVGKCVNLRIFEDKNDRMNLSLLDIKGAVLVISQFTLYADCRKGRRPGFDRSMPPDEASALYNLLIEEFKKTGLAVEKGTFGAKMDVELVNDGPVTIMLDDEEI